MNNIATVQNQQRQLERLAAQRELYNSAKNHQGLQFILNVVLPVLLGLICLFDERTAIWAAAYGLLISIIDPYMIEATIKNKWEQAAKIQELFDCEVLELRSSPLKLADDDMVEQVLTHYKAHSKISSNIEKLRDWYPVAVSQLPIELARLVCQRTNCWWDSRLRNRYANSIKILGISMIVILLALAVFKNKEFSHNILVASALLPFLQYCLKQHQDQKDAALRLDKLIAFGRKIWMDDLGKGNAFLDEQARRMQDEIFEHRRSSPSILNFIYNRFRDTDEDIMNTTAMQLIDEARRKGLI